MIRMELDRTRRLALALGMSVIASLGCAGGALADTSPAASGAFVIGDASAQVTAPVTFWGAQWWKDNSLTGGDAPASFKGWADTATPQCGQTWTTRPGNSSQPPATVQPAADAYGWVPMAVASQITKSGPVITGNTAEIAWVQLDAGYGPDPGHPGTGTIKAISCTDPALPTGGSGNGGGITLN
jgi:hypothetical protein